VSDETLSQNLARHHSALQFDQIPGAVIDAAKLHILDSLGCLLAGTRLEPGKLAYELAIKTSGTTSQIGSTLFGTAQRVSYLDAVQAMSVAAHCGEMDDIHGGAGTCIGGMIVPAMLAMAEKYGGTGKRFLEAAVSAYETIIRVGLSIDAPQLFAGGWWPSTICGAFGVAAAGAKFLNWPQDQTANALGIAALHSGGMITGGNQGATARHLAFGHAAQNGIHSLVAAEQGFSGPKRAFEDPRGFCLTLCPEPKWVYLQSFGTFHLPEVAFKPYPCARQLHAGVEALLYIIRQHALMPERIDEIELAVPTQNAGMVNRPSITASHAATVGSGQYVMAVTVLRGEIDLASFDAEFLNSGAVRNLMAKVKVIGSAELDRHFPKYWPGRVTLKSGSEIYSEEVIIPKGEAENPMRRNEVEEKFFSLAAPIIADEKARSVVQEVEALEARDSLNGLLAFLKAFD
jgi:2-methylcitrate dehydratase PrpD